MHEYVTHMHKLILLYCTYEDIVLRCLNFLEVCTKLKIQNPNQNTQIKKTFNYVATYP